MQISGSGVTPAYRQGRNLADGMLVTETGATASCLHLKGSVSGPRPFSRAFLFPPTLQALYLDLFMRLLTLVVLFSALGMPLFSFSAFLSSNLEGLPKALPLQKTFSD